MTEDPSNLDNSLADELVARAILRCNGDRGKAYAELLNAVVRFAARQSKDGSCAPMLTIAIDALTATRDAAAEFENAEERAQ